MSIRSHRLLVVVVTLLLVTAPVGQVTATATPSGSADAASHTLDVIPVDTSSMPDLAALLDRHLPSDQDQSSVAESDNTLQRDEPQTGQPSTIDTSIDQLTAGSTTTLEGRGIGDRQAVAPDLSREMNYSVRDNFTERSTLWSWSGSAEYSAQNDHVILTRPIEGGQAGILWLNQKLNPPLTAEFDFKAGGGSGADGIVFMFNKKREYQPSSGGRLAFMDENTGAVPGYGVEFDNWENLNYNDPSERHIALIEDSVGNHVTARNDRRVEDNQWHHARIEVRNDTVSVFVDGDLIFNTTREINTTYNSVGFAASTGGSNNFHRIDNVSIRGQRADTRNLRPRADIDIQPTTVTTNTTVRLDARGSRDPNGDQLDYSWDLDNDSEAEATGPVVNTTFASGDRTVRLIASDGERSDEATRTFRVYSNDSVPTARFKIGNTTNETVRVDAGSTLQFSARASEAPSGSTLRGYRWAFGNGETAGGIDAPASKTVSQTFRTPGTYSVELRVTDADGRTDTTLKQVVVEPPEAPVITDISQPANGKIPQSQQLNDSGVPNTWRVETTGASQIESVNFTFPGGVTIVDRDGSDGWSASPSISELSDGTVVITARDVNGNTTQRTVPVETIGLPAWANSLNIQDGSLVLKSGYQFPEIEKDIGVAEFNVSFTVEGRTKYDFSDSSVAVGGGGGGSARAIPPSGVGAEVTGKVTIEGSGVVEDDQLVIREVTVKGKLEGGPVFQRDVGLTEALAVEVTSKLLVGSEFSATLDTQDELEIAKATVAPGVTVVPASVSAGSSAYGVTLAEVGVEGEVSFKGTVTISENTSTGGKAEGKITAYAILVGTKVSTEVGAGVSTSEATAGEWEFVEKETVSPATARAKLLESTDSRVRQFDAGDTGAEADSIALTDNGVSDRAPAVAVDGDQVTAVAASQDPNKTILNGSEITLHTRGDGQWIKQPAVTNDSRYDSFPAVASQNGTRLVAWSRANESLDRESVETPYDTFQHFDIALARSNGSKWTAPRQITNNSLPEFDATVAANDDRWLIAWVTDTDRNLTTATDREVRYAMVAQNGSIVDRGTVGTARTVAVAPASNGTFQLAALNGQGADTDVVHRRISERGSTLASQTRAAPNATEIAASADRIAWIRTTTEDPTIEVLNTTSGNAVTVSPGRAAIEHLSLRSRSDKRVLSYEAVPRGADRTATLFTQINGNGTDGWTDPVSLPTDGRGIQRAAFALVSNQTVGVFTATPSSDVRPDLYATNRSIAAPDLAVNLTQAAASQGTATVNVTVSNQGGRRSANSSVTVTGPNGQTVTRNVTSLSPGGETTESITLRRLSTGTVSATVDQNMSTAEPRTENNADAIQLRSQLAITNVEDTLSANGSKLRLTIDVRNSGPYAAENVTYNVTTGNQTHQLTIPAVGINQTWETSLALNASAIDTNQPAVVTVGAMPSESAGEFPANRRRVLLRQPDVGIVEAPAESANSNGTIGGIVRNTDTGETTATVSVRTGSKRIDYTVPVPASSGPSDAVQVPVSLEPPRANNSTAVSIRVRPDGDRDADLADNLLTTTAPANRSDGYERSLSVAAVEPNGSATGPGRIDVTVSNPHNITVGRAITVVQNGSVILQQGVAVSPNASKSVTLHVERSGTVSVQIGNTTRTVSVISTPSAVGDSFAPPTDPDGDGVYEDVNGNGQMDIGDVQALFVAQQDGESTTARQGHFYDFNGDGGLDVVDVQALFVEVSEEE